MKRILSLLIVCGLGVAVGVAVAADEKMPFADAPAKVRAALQKLAGDAKIATVEMEKKHGVVCYEAEWKVDGKEVEAVVTADGELVTMEQEVNAQAVPAMVEATAARQFPEGTELEYEKTTIVLYEIEGKVAGKEKEIMIRPNGQLVSKSKHDDDDHDGDDAGDDDEDDGEDDDG